MVAMADRDERAFRALASATLSPTHTYQSSPSTVTTTMSIGKRSSSQRSLEHPEGGGNCSFDSGGGEFSSDAIDHSGGAGSSGNNNHDELDRQNKIRLVERLTTLKHDEWPDDGHLQSLAGHELSSLLERYVMSVVEQLVDMASDNVDMIEEINQLDHHGFNLLQYCCLFNQTGLIPVLLKRGVDCNIVSRHGSAPLHIAASVGSLSIVQILLHNGASLFTKDSNDHYPMQVAMGCGHGELHRFLLQLGTSQGTLCPHDYVTWVGTDMDSEIVYSQDSYLGLESGLLGQVDSASEREIFKDMFNDFSLKDKVALSQSLGRSADSDMDGGSSTFGGLDDDFDLDMQSVLSESDKESLNEAMRVMGTNELAEVSQEVQSIQKNVRMWMLRKNYLNLRQATKTLQGATRAWRERKRGSNGSSSGSVRHLPCSSSVGGAPASPALKHMDEAANTLQRFAKNFRHLRQQAVASLMVRQRYNRTPSGSKNEG